MRVSFDGSVTLRWCRRARGAWSWQDGVDTPLGEQTEAYSVGAGDPSAPHLVWSVGEPRLELPPATWSDLIAAHAGEPLWVRQSGTVSLSDPLFLATIA